MQTKPNHNPQAGFSLIEMIVSLALFSVVITIAVGALLILIASNRQLQNEQSILSNLSFALDSMTREIRTGSAYYCDSASDRTGSDNIFRNGNNLDDTISTTENDDCRLGRPTTNSGNVHGITFVEGGNSVTGSGSDRILYFHDRADGKIYRRIDNDAAESIVSGGVFVSDMEFSVTGSDDLLDDNDEIQPKVTVFIEAYASEQAANEDATGELSHKIQTTITQRSLDI